VCSSDLESVDWEYFPKTIDAIKSLKESGYLIVGIEQAVGSVELQDIKINKGKTYALVFGNEIDGVDQDVLNLCDLCVEIPQFGTKHSFNIAISAGIVLWEVNKNLSQVS
jgi:tRNA G18 (ribose-2'-O)-methylase SpoU